MTYRKLWFASRQYGRTAGLVVTDAWVEKHASNLIPEASRLFPRSECLKMKKMFISPTFDTFAEAFAFDSFPTRVLVKESEFP